MLGYIGIMENRMETTIGYWGYIVVIYTYSMEDIFGERFGSLPLQRASNMLWSYPVVPSWPDAL